MDEIRREVNRKNRIREENRRVREIMEEQFGIYLDYGGAGPKYYYTAFGNRR